MKRGQVTIFIILGVIIVAIAVLLLFFKGQVSESLIKTGIIKKGAVDLEADKVEREINDCLEGLLIDATYQVAANGGYEEKQETAYYTQNNRLTAPEVSILEESVSSYIKSLLPFCLIGMDIRAEVDTGSSSRLSTSISEDTIKVVAEYPVQVTLGDDSTRIEDFSSQIDSRLGTMHDLALELAEIHKDKPAICFSCIFEKGDEYDVKIDVYSPPETEDIVFVMTDQKTDKEQQALTYIFAIKPGELS